MTVPVNEATCEDSAQASPLPATPSGTTQSTFGQLEEPDPIGDSWWRYIETGLPAR